MTNQTIIYFSKKKLLLLVFGSCVFAAVGFWMLQMDSAEIAAQRRFNSPIFVHGMGAIALAFAVVCAGFGIIKFFDKRPGFILSASGIHDNSSAVAVGHIPWSEIVGFNVVEIQKQKTLVVMVADAEKYIEAGGFVRRKINRMNFHLVGSPIAITSNSLQISFVDLLDSCNRYFVKYAEKV